MARTNSRKLVIRGLTTIVVIALLIGIVSFALYGYCMIPSISRYKEVSEVDYKVLIKENEFYEEEYLEKDNQYIASIIDDIDAKFYYALKIPQDVDYEYSYKAKAVVQVKERANNNLIYRIEEDLIDTDYEKKTGELTINYSVPVDYSRYNEVITKFIKIYDLKNVESTVEVALYVDVNNFSSTKEEIKEKKVAKIVVPLGENTISIDNKEKTMEGEFVVDEVHRENTTYLLYVGGVASAIALIVFIYEYIYIMKTRTARMIYEKEIKSIINNYDTYIQRIGSSYDIGTSQVIKIESFSDMLEIRDTLKQPILMLENKEKNGTFFIIPATNSIIYTYALRIEDIEAKMKGREIPTYDITEIPQSEFIKKKKYTDDYIKDELTRTAMMPVIDEKNVIKGNKDKDTDLYDQLELTKNFNVDEIKKAAKAKKKTNIKAQKKNYKQNNSHRKQNRKTDSKKKK